MIFVKIRTFGLFVLVGLFFANCGENSSQTSKLSNSTDSVNFVDTMNSAGAGLIGTDSGIVIIETQRKPTQLLGIWQQMPISALRESIKVNAQLIVNCIVEHKYQMDGGLTVLGANLVNMGLIGTFGGYYLYLGIRKALGFNSWRSMAIAVAVAAWTSVVVAALACALQLALSGTVPPLVALFAMLSWHILIGIGEAVITVFAVGYIWRTRPDLLYDPPHSVNTSVSPS